MLRQSRPPTKSYPGGPTTDIRGFPVRGGLVVNCSGIGELQYSASLANVLGKGTRENTAELELRLHRQTHRHTMLLLFLQL